MREFKEILTFTDYRMKSIYVLVQEPSLMNQDRRKS